MENKSQKTQPRDGVLFTWTRTDSTTPFCGPAGVFGVTPLEWKREVIILNNSSQKMDLIYEPNHVMNLLHRAAHQMRAVKFEAMNIEISRYHWNEINDKIVELEERFYQDLSTLLNQPDFPAVKVLVINPEYLTPISILLTKFSDSLVELDIHIKVVWIKYERISNKNYEFPEDLMFPRLKKLTLKFSDHRFGYLRKEGDPYKIAGSKSLKILLKASLRIVELALKNYGRLPCNFGCFKNLRKLTIYGKNKFFQTLLHLHDCLTKFLTLPTDKLRSFKLVFRDVDVQDDAEKALLCFLQKQRQSLKNLTLSFILIRRKNRIPIHGIHRVTLPRCMPNLEKLWISVEDDKLGSDSAHGFKLRTQIRKEKSRDFEIIEDTSKAPWVVRDGRECGQGLLCRGCNGSLVFGKLREFRRDNLDSDHSDSQLEIESE
ncbi:hypothetical protein Fcan01_17762 [Folsomia candida]|uniref:Uncharacterized protein n=1 Tax=Folsomia candida TaxID=158441 RepID=A0A226DSI1_FOLCA|nr:hypothetical protein Fcan01_17762 [Folsomia candida]